MRALQTAVQCGMLCTSHKQPNQPNQEIPTQIKGGMTRGMFYSRCAHRSCACAKA